MSYKITDTIIVDQNKNIGSIGIATFAGPVLIGGGTSTGTVSQPLQVTGSNGAYIGGNLGIGSTNPSSKLWVSGDIYNTGIHTAQVLSASKDPGTGIATDFTNSLFGNGWRVSSPGSTTYYKLATLPPGGGGSTFDHLIINGVLGAWTNGNQTPFEITFSNRGSFNYKYVSYGSVRSDVRIIGISTNSNVEIWAQHQASQFTKLVYNIANSIQAIVVSNPTSTTTAPTGTTVFDSSTVTPRFIINESDNVGIGTATPTSKLQVVGDVLVSGIVTANSFRGDGSLLTGITGGISSVSISTNTTNQSQYLTYAIGTGNTTGLGVSLTGLVFNPSSGNLGIGTTSATSKLDIFGNVKVTGIVTATTFSGTLSGYASSAGISTNLNGGLAGNIVYQSAPNTTAFLTNGTGGFVLQSNGVGNAPTWVAAAPSGAVSGITVRDSNSNLVGTSGSITQLTFSSGLSVTGTTGAAGIATITLSNNIVGTSLSISGISTFNNTLNVVPTATSIAGLFSGTTSGDMVRITQLGSGNALVVEDSANPDSSPFVVKGDGSVGIGTNNPTVALQLSPNASISNLNASTNFGTTAGAAATVAQFYHLNGNASYLRIKATRNTAGADWTTASTKLLQVIDVTEQGYIEYNPSGSTYGMAFGSGATEWARFLSSGNLGIGRTNPTSKLEVLGTIAAYSADTTSVGSFVISNAGLLDITSFKSTGGTLRFVTANTSGTNLDRGRVDSSGNFIIGTTSATGTASQKLQVTGGAYVSDNLGIGTTNPTSTLQVQGNTLITGISTSAEFVGGGSDLRNLSGTHLVSYASASDISNSALSIAGISTYNQVGILTGSFATNASDAFGSVVATSADGKTIVVGAPADETGATTDTGVVYVFDRVGNSFNQVGILTGSLASQSNDYFGGSVATSSDGKTIVVGASNDEIGATETGVVYVFDRVGSSFNQVGILTGSLATNASDSFGQSVATSSDGKTIVVGASNDEIGAATETGIVYVFDRVGNSFNQVGILTGSLATNASDNFGYGVAASSDGKTIIVSAYLDEIGATTSTGVVYVFDRVGSSFNQVGILTGSFAVDSNDFFGQSVATSADGKTIVVGAYFDEIGGTSDTGVGYVFDRVGSSFNQVGILTGSFATNTNDRFGQSVATSADGKTIVVGAPADEIGAGTNTGLAYIFKRQGNSFNQVGIVTGSLVGASDSFGTTVSISADGKSIIVGAPDDEISAATSTGIVYVFDEIRETYVYSGPTGNIGIGITDPTQKLHVQGNVRVTGGIYDSNNNVGTAGSVLSSTGSGLSWIPAASGVPAYATSAGIATYATNAGIATYATNAGVSTNVIGGIGSITQLQVTGISTFTNGPVLIGSATSTGTASQPLQVTGGAYVSDNLGIGTTNPTSKLHVVGNVLVSGVTTSGGVNVTTGNDYKINSTSVLTSTTLGSAVVNSSLTSVGTLGILNVTGVTTSGGVNVTTGNDYKINNTSVLTSTTLGSAVVNSSLTSVGTLGILNVTGVTTSGGVNVTTGNDYKINGTSVLTSTTLGSAVVNSSLTSVGTLGILNVTGVTTASRFVSGIATGTAPLTVTSTTKVTNLNADLLDDNDSTYYTNASNLSSGTVPSARITASSGDFTVGQNLNVTGNISVGGTTVILNAATLQVKDKDIVLGITTNASNQDVSTDTTANHGGVAIASTEGTPLIDIVGGVGTDTIPSTYKQIMWLKSGSWTGLGTDAWLFNYGVGIGSTQVPLGVRLAAGGMQVTDRTITTPQLSVTGVTTSGGVNVTTGNDYKINGTSVLTSTTLGSAVVTSSLTSVGTLGVLNVTGVTTSGGFNATTGNDYKINGTSVLTSTTLGSAVVNSSLTSVGTLGLLSVTGISTFNNGPVLIGTGTSTGTASQPLQVTGGAYVSGNLGIGTTNPFGSNIYSGLDVNRANVKIFARNIGTASDAAVWAADQDYFATPSYKGVGIVKFGPGTAGTMFSSIPYADTGVLSFQNTTTALIYTNGQSPLIFGTFSLERARFDGLTGNFGIGTTLPSSKLHVVGDAFVSGITTSGGFNATTGNDYKINGTSVLTNNTLGSGVVNSSLTSVGTLGILNVTGVTTSGGVNVTIGNDYKINGTSVLTSTTLGSAVVNSSLTSVGTLGSLSVTGISTFTNGPVLIGGGTSTGTSGQVLQVAGINSSVYIGGNLGIGTTNPTSKLWVGGDGYFAGIVTSSGFYVGGSLIGGSISGTNLVGTALSVSGISTFTNGPVLIGAATSTGTASQRLQVTGGAYVSGSVGIGTTNPGATLNVVPTASSIAGLFSGTTSSDMVRITQLGTGNALVVEDSANPDSSPFVVTGIGSVGIGTASPAFTADIAGDARVTSTNKMRFGGTAGTTNFYIQYNSTTNSLDFVAG